MHSVNALSSLHRKGQIKNSQSPEKVYLSRMYHDCFRSRANIRTANYTQIIHWCKKENISIVFPEKLSFWELYETLRCARTIYSDMGSSQTHAIINAGFLERRNSRFVPFVAPSFFAIPYSHTQIWDWYYTSVVAGSLCVHKALETSGGDGRPGTECVQVSVDQLPL